VRTRQLARLEHVREPATLRGGFDVLAKQHREHAGVDDAQVLAVVDEPEADRALGTASTRGQRAFDRAGHAQLAIVIGRDELVDELLVDDSVA